MAQKICRIDRIKKRPENINVSLKRSFSRPRLVNELAEDPLPKPVPLA